MFKRTSHRTGGSSLHGWSTRKQNDPTLDATNQGKLVKLRRIRAEKAKKKQEEQAELLRKSLEQRPVKLLKKDETFAVLAATKRERVLAKNKRRRASKLQQTLT